MCVVVVDFIILYTAFVSSTKYRNDKHINTIVVAIPFSVLLLQLIILVLYRPFKDRLQWVSVTVITVIEWSTFLVQLLDVHGEVSFIEEMNTDVLVFLLWCSSIGVQMITKLYGTIFELVIAFKKLYYVFMSKLVFEKGDFELNEAQNSTFIVVKDGIAVTSAVSEYSRRNHNNAKQKKWSKRSKATNRVAKMKKVHIAPSRMQMDEV